jgi:subtilase family serine protease
LPADLVPLPSTPGSTDPLSFCQSTTFQELDVHVANQGSSPAPASTTHVDFANSGGVDMPTPALAPGASAIVTFAIPATCFNAVSQCSFTIVVDSANVVTESNETNNSAAGLCQSS